MGPSARRTPGAGVLPAAGPPRWGPPARGREHRPCLLRPASRSPGHRAALQRRPAVTAMERPSPQPDELSEEFSARGRDRLFALHRCHHCGTMAHPPIALCDHSNHITAPSFSYTPVSGRGRVVSWTVIRRAFVSAFEDRVPTTYA